MFLGIIVGLLIGVASAVVLNGMRSIDPKALLILQWFVGVIATGFILLSFMFGAVIGVMAVAEINIGYFAYSKLFQRSSAKS
ncbi:MULTISPECIES: hypothetical protein [unclassified Pseudomonas]|uniref:hypothetical protein n=1 Tax=unclassified Pseudomonas TaxID=196821 RepID=UPI0011A51775|nr:MULTISPECIES: hypothetical protein [unclassified Pseudomonas]TWC27658.1 hypothetical protein FBY05_101523 [Pseudomonas sp. SJZ083]TWC54002.1 hypothetical protein FBY01_101193 [Pseudomonas sp. SJZ077]